MAARVCEECTDAPPATHSCVQCDILLCEECFRQHRKSKRTAGHETHVLALHDVVGDADIHRANGVCTDTPPRPAEQDAPSDPVSSSGKKSSPSGRSLLEIMKRDVEHRESCKHKEDNMAALLLRKHVMMWQIQLTRQHLPNFKPAHLDASPGAQEVEAPGWLGIEFKNRKDGTLIITRTAEGGPADGLSAIMEGDILVAINDTFVRKLEPSRIAELVKGPPGSAINITLGAEFLPYKDYTAKHVLASGECITVKRVKPVLRLEKMEADVGLLSPGLRMQQQGDRYGVTDDGDYQQLVSPGDDDEEGLDRYLPTVAAPTNLKPQGAQNKFRLGAMTESEAQVDNKQPSWLQDGDAELDSTEEDYTDITDSSVSPRTAAA